MAHRHRIFISPQAADDFQSIYDYVARDSPQHAAALIAKLLDAVESLAVVPHRQTARHQSVRIPRPVRSLPVPPYVIYFRVMKAEHVVRVLTIRHGARRPPTLS